MLRLRTLFIALSLASLLLAACACRQAAVTLNDVETYIKERPDSAQVTIRAIDTTPLTTPKLRAHYALLHAMAYIFASLLSILHLKSPFIFEKVWWP